MLTFHLAQRSHTTTTTTTATTTTADAAATTPTTTMSPNRACLAQPMNEVWNKWVDPSNKPTRFCVEANMALDNILVEVQVTAVTNA